MPKNSSPDTAPDAAMPAPTSTAAEEMQMPASGGTDSVVVALNRAMGVFFLLPDGRRVEIHGNAVHLRGCELGTLPTGGAYGLTTIPRADWEAVKAAYGNTALFQSGRIFAQDSLSEARAEALDHADTRHGLEPVAGRHTVEARAEA